MSFPPGTQIGRFRISRMIAQGGMAEVYRAEQELAGGIIRPAALKVIRPEYSESPDFREMFLDEARLACTLSHPNIVHIYEVGESDGRLFMAMELVPGESLAHVSRSLRERGERFSVEALIAIGIFTCSALEMVHALRVPGQGHVNLVHRDVSPHNLLLGPNGSLKLIDFGIAKATTNRNLTSAGVTKGKAGYFSPEQAMGRPLDGRSDLFSLGVTLYKLAWGATPFDHHRTHHERNTALVHGRWRGLKEVCPGLPDGFYAIVDRALQVRPEARFANAAEMRVALETLALESGFHVGPSTLAGYVEPQEDDPMALGARPLPASARHERPATQGVANAAVTVIAPANAATMVATGMPASVAGETRQAPPSGAELTAAPPTRNGASAVVQSGLTPPSSVSSPAKPRHTERLAPRAPGRRGSTSRASSEIQRTRRRLFFISGSAVVLMGTVLGMIIGTRIAETEVEAQVKFQPLPPPAEPMRPAPSPEPPRTEVARGEPKAPPPLTETPAVTPAVEARTPPPVAERVVAKKEPARTSPRSSSRNREVIAAKTPVALPEPGTKPPPTPAVVETGVRSDGKLRIGGTDDAQIEVNGKRWGMSPLDRKVPPGTYSVVVRSLEGKKELSKVVEVKPDQATMVRFDFARGVISSNY
ncbi:MAG: protein kinase [Myxococcaceae bacterium]|nr:protein kinase [Myxococcaceae bacterium]